MHAMCTITRVVAVSIILFFFLLLPPPPTSTLFPYTTLFRSTASLTQRSLLRPRILVPRTDPRIPNKATHRLPRGARPSSGFRSEEHTSELQSRPHLVCRLLLEKKKKKKINKTHQQKQVHTRP